MQTNIASGNASQSSGTVPRRAERLRSLRNSSLPLGSVPRLGELVRTTRKRSAWYSQLTSSQCQLTLPWCNVHRLNVSLHRLAELFPTTRNCSARRCRLTECWGTRPRGAEAFPVMRNSSARQCKLTLRLRVRTLPRCQFTSGRCTLRRDRKSPCLCRRKEA